MQSEDIEVWLFGGNVVYMFLCTDKSGPLTDDYLCTLSVSVRKLVVNLYNANFTASSKVATGEQD